MLTTYTDRIINRLNQLVKEIEGAWDFVIDYHDRLREFRQFCDDTPALAQLIAQLPHTPYDFKVDRRDMQNQWRSGKQGYAMRWDAIKQIVDGGPQKVQTTWLQIGAKDLTTGLRTITENFVVPIYHFLVDQLEKSSATLYVLLRYKRWVEWFKADHLHNLYETHSRIGEGVLDNDLRRFLFESGIDYPFSQPASPRGKVDVVARLETDDPLVLEIKVWDSNKGYKEDRVRDGLRQVMDYAARYGKDKGYIVVFNIDQEPLYFVSQEGNSEWPPRIEYGGRTYFFIDVHIAKIAKPISQQDKGKRIQSNTISLENLLDES
jgi:hypothetical protein